MRGEKGVGAGGGSEYEGVGEGGGSEYEGVRGWEQVVQVECEEKVGRSGDRRRQEMRGGSAGGERVGMGRNSKPAWSPQASLA